MSPRLFAIQKQSVSFSITARAKLSEKPTHSTPRCVCGLCGYYYPRATLSHVAFLHSQRRMQNRIFICQRYLYVFVVSNFIRRQMQSTVSFTVCIYSQKVTKKTICILSFKIENLLFGCMLLNYS